MFTVNRLCCMRLHTAGIVVGWVGAALSLLNVIAYAVILSRIDQIVKYIIDQNSNNTLSEETLKTVAIAGIATYLTLSVVNMVSSILLIAGTMKERHLMLVPWLINNGFMLFISVLNFAYVLYYSISNSNSFGSIMGMVIISGLILGIQYLIWTAIYSLFRNIRMSTEQQQLIPNKAGTAYPSYTRI